jgi:hypothetical protein
MIVNCSPNIFKAYRASWRTTAQEAVKQTYRLRRQLRDQLLTALRDERSR